MANSVKELAQKTLQANKDHQYALKVYTERLEAELATVDKLLTSAEWDEQDDEVDLDAGGFVLIPGSVKPSGPVAHSDLLSKDSPFREDAIRRQKYLELTTIHPMKNKELEALAEAVRTENYRMHAYEAQRRGQNALTSLNQQPQSYFEMNKESIDWEGVASKVSSSISSYVQRSAQECKIRWLGDRHPEINHKPWLDTEVAQAIALAANYPDGRVNWVRVAEQLGTNRTAMDCMRNAVQRRNHVWTSGADDRLLEAIKIYGIDNWLLVARYVSEDATAQQCQNRYHRTVTPDLARGPWTDDEDAKLRRAVEAYGHSWLEVASSIPGRSNEQCRDRWSERLNPKVAKGKWTEEEGGKLMEAVARVGEKWKEVSECLNGRTDKMCRVRYEKLKKDKEPPQPEHPSSCQVWQSLRFREVPGSGQEVASPSNPAYEGQEASAAPPPVSSPVPRPKPKPRPRKKGKPPATAVDEQAADNVTPPRTPTAGNSQEGAPGTLGTADEPNNENVAANTTGTTKRSRRKAAPALDVDVPAPKRRKPTKKVAAATTTTADTEAQNASESLDDLEQMGNASISAPAQAETAPTNNKGKGKAKAPPKPRARPRKKNGTELSVDDANPTQEAETTTDQLQEAESSLVDATVTAPTPPEAEAASTAHEPNVEEAPALQESSSTKSKGGSKKSAGTKSQSAPARVGTRRSTRLQQVGS